MGLCVEMDVPILGAILSFPPPQQEALISKESDWYHRIHSNPFPLPRAGPRTPPLLQEPSKNYLLEEGDAFAMGWRGGDTANTSLG